MGETGKTVSAPYVSPPTFEGFLAKLKPVAPARVDKSLFNGYSGSAIAQIMGALKFLRLIEEDGTTLPGLQELMDTEGESRQAFFQAAIRDCYQFMSDGFDLKTATQGMLDEKFKEAGASGDTIRKCSHFFLWMAKEAGFELSTQLKTPSARATIPRKSAKKTRAKKPSGGEAQTTLNGAVSPGGQPQVADFDALLLQKLPAFNPEWSDEAQTAWLKALSAISAKAKGEDTK